VSGHIDDRIPELVLGDLSDDERARLEAHAAGCARCAAELDAAVEAFALIGAALPPRLPPPSLRARLLADARPRPMAAFAGELAALFDVTQAHARAIIDRLDDPAAWQPGPMAGSWLMLCRDAGPKVAGAFCGFVKMNPRLQWPRHTHLGTELMLVLQGGFRQHDGVEVHAGQTHVMTDGSSHAFTIFDDEPCVSAAVIHGDVRFDESGATLSDLLK
jgi:hypothetical protein